MYYKKNIKNNPFNRVSKDGKKVMEERRIQFNGHAFNKGINHLSLESDDLLNNVYNRFNLIGFNRGMDMFIKDNDYEGNNQILAFNRTRFNAINSIQPKEVDNGTRLSFGKYGFNNFHDVNYGTSDDENIIEEINVKFQTKTKTSVSINEIHMLRSKFETKSNFNASITVFVDPKKGRYIKVLDDKAEKEYGKITNIIDPLVYEVINADYDFSFSSVIDEMSKYFTDEYILQVVDDYFKVSNVKASRSSGVSVDISCEHISYELINEHDEAEVYETEAYEMLTEVLKDTRFSVGVVEFEPDDVRYYEPSDTSVRKRIIEIANLFGGEVLYNKFTISLLRKRQTTESVHGFSLGKNLEGITSEIDYTENPPREAYDIDVLDLAQNKKYAFLKTIGLGDAVHVEDPQLKIDKRLRIVSYERNPFQKINPNVQIGNVIRDYTDFGTGSNGGERKDSGFYIESETSPFSKLMIFMFEKEYDEVLSITTGLLGNIYEENITLVSEPFKENGKYKGVYITTNSIGIGVKGVSMQAINKIN